ncbi:MAG TPA: ferric reductase-like transmembrane domain-containing protein, partial [Acidimicrobiales bacterium]
TLPWYVARASGLVAWALLAGAVVWGLLMTTKIVRRRVRNAWLLDLHRWLGGLALVFTGVHVLAILGDTYVHFGLASVLVPLTAHWHPVAVALGVASLYLLVAVEVTSLIRRRLPHRLWRRVHMLSFPLFVLSTVHGLSAGTDGRTPMALIAAGLVTVAVGFLGALRLGPGADRRPAGGKVPAGARRAASGRVPAGTGRPVGGRGPAEAGTAMGSAGSSERVLVG